MQNRIVAPRKVTICIVRSMLTSVILLTFLAAGYALQNQAKSETGSVNSLTAAEKAAGWKLLFDGKTTTGWRGFRRDKFPEEGWVIEDGAIKHVASNGEQSQNGGDIITVDQYDNFELRLEWRISPGGNSGIKYLIAEEMVKSGHSGLGFEMQVLDDNRHPDAKKGKAGNRTAGGLYDLIAPQNKVLRPVGQWNRVRLVVAGNHVEHWLNDVKVVTYELGSPALKALIAESKYQTIPGFGEVRKGHLLLQDHGDEVWYRNIKLRSLPAPKSSNR